jgi:hypothetical protein
VYLSHLKVLFFAFNLFSVSSRSRSQVAKLYGFAEKLQFQQIDRLENEEVKPFRKEFAKRCNSVLDLLEQKNQNKTFSLVGESSILRIIQLTNAFYCSVSLQSGSVLKFIFYPRDVDNSLSHLIVALHNKLLNDGFLETPVSQIFLTPLRPSMTELLSIRHTLASHEKLFNVSCSIHHLHELAAASAPWSSDLPVTNHLVLSADGDLLTVSLFHRSSPDCLSHVLFTSLDLSLCPQPSQAIETQLQRAAPSPSTSLPISAVWCVGSHRDMLHQSIAPSLSSLRSLTFLSSPTLVSSETVLPLLSEDSLHTVPLPALETPLSLFQLGLSSQQLRGYVPMLHPSSPLPCAVTQRLIAHLPQSFSYQPAGFTVNLVVTEKGSVSSERRQSALSLAISCPHSAISHPTAQINGALALDVTLALSADRELSVAILPLVMTGGQLFPVTPSLDSSSSCLFLSLHSQGSNSNCHSLSTISGEVYSITLLSGDLSAAAHAPTAVNGDDGSAAVLWCCEESASRLKQLGNDCMAQEDFSGAVDAYTAALDCDLCNGILYSNRCAALTKLTLYSSALSDAEECVRLLPLWEKGWSRRGGILSRMGRLDESIQSYEKGIPPLPPLLSPLRLSSPLPH